MSIELKQLNFRRFIENGAEMYDLLESNRGRLEPWFWWAGRNVTPNKMRFYIFMTLYIADTKRKKIAHTFNPSKSYDEQFFVYNESGKIGGMVGLDNIDTKTNKNAEVWGLAFKGNNETIASIKLLEEYCINTLGLNSIYGKVQSQNRASRYFWEKYGYDEKTLEQNVRISKRNPKIADIYTYTKYLVR